MPAFSVIIPAFNREKLISATLESVLSQTFMDYEVIVVDDGSTDGTIALVEDFAARFPDKIRLFKQPNTGPGAARNLAATHARGEYLFFLDSDDLWFPWTLETYALTIRNHRPSVIISSQVAFTDPATLSNVSPTAFEEKLFPDYLASVQERFFRASCVLAVRKDAFDAIGGFTQEISCAEDHDLLFRLSTAQGFIHLVSPPLVAYRLHGGSISRETSERVISGNIYLLRRELAGMYPGGKPRRGGRLSLIIHGLRNVSWNAFSEGKTRWAWRLYRMSLIWNLRSAHFGYLIGFPFLVLLGERGRRIVTRRLSRPL